MRFFAVFSAFVSLLSAGSPVGGRDWTKNPVVVQIDTTADLFAVGDAHSDYVHLTRALHAAGIIASRPEQPQQAQWSAGSAVLISTGDMIDKGPRALDVLKLYQTLRVQARLAGGEVVILAGNHEAEFLANPTALKGTAFSGQLKAAGIDPADVAARARGEVRPVHSVRSHLPLASTTAVLFLMPDARTVAAYPGSTPMCEPVSKRTASVARN